MERKCKICRKEFYAKPSHVTMGYGVYCSRNCRNIGMREGKYVKCDICKMQIYKRPLEILRSKSKKYFCSKSCQAIWRNKYFSGNKHLLWKGGHSTYRDKMFAKQEKQACTLCKVKDKRVLAVHHIDKNRSNNSISNLAWLCHNCHYLVHFYEKERQKFELLRSN